jgi:ubiquinone/menaquinone biosynthesis C-methylase UbiE/uncharacterized protein YbaR (Trm112 family)
MIPLVCPACHGTLRDAEAALTCTACALTFPVVAGIPDLRLEPDPYIGLDDDRRKAAHLAEAGRTRTFGELVRYYYSITPEDPADLAERWTARAVDDVNIGRALLDALPFSPGEGPVLDLGCGTAGLTIAIASRGASVVGVDIALRWLVVAQRRLDAAGGRVRLVCASARRLPFADGVMRAIVGNDLLEHADRPDEVLRESGRVAAPGAAVLLTGNNRYAPLPEPQLRLWGVGYLPRTWQRAYVSTRRRDTHPYRIVLRSGSEVARLARAAGLDDVAAQPAPMVAPHRGGAVLRRSLQIYNAVRGWPIIRPLARRAGPRWMVTARRA